jgi:integrase
VNFLERTVTVRESKTDAGRRVIPLNGEAWDTVLELYDRAKTIEGHAPQFFVFPACENNRIDPAKAQRSWRSAWRALRKKAGLQALRFHDLRHHAITELAESQASDQTIMAIAGHVSREMLEHYSHVRLEAKRRAVEALSQRDLTQSYVTRHDTTGGDSTSAEFSSETKDWSGREDLNLRPPGPEPGALPG